MFTALGPGAVPAGAAIGVCTGWSLSKPRSHVPSRGGRRRRSGIVAAAGVVNQADEQCILLPGYFTTPGLHHTHPLQASLVGPGGLACGVGWGGSLCKRVFSSARGFSVTPLLSVRWVGSFPKMPDAGSSAPPPPQPLESPAGGARLAFVRGPGVRLSPAAVRAESLTPSWGSCHSPAWPCSFCLALLTHHCCPMPPHSQHTEGI